MRVGIDLGTTYSLVARLDDRGRPQLLPDHSDHDTVHTPSVVHIAAQSAFVGRGVETLLEQDPDLKVVRFFKRHLGDAQPLYYDNHGTAWHAETLSALVLKKLRFDAESYCSTEVEHAVITVPAHFSHPQRRALLAAAALADITVLGLVEEPVAAALHYGIQQGSRDEVLLVFDWGGGTFDATALSMNANGVYVLAKTGLTELGGKEVDERIGAIVLSQLEQVAGGSVALTARGLLELRRVSEELKIELCMPNRPRVRKTILVAGHAIEVDIDRRTFDAAVSDLVDQAFESTARCLADAGLRDDDVNVVVLVGGSSMVPAVGERMRARFSGPNQRVLFHDPTKAVAFGAALHAAQLDGVAEQYQLPPELRGVSGYSVGVRAVSPATGRVSIDTLIRQNMPLPTKVAKTYYTTRPNQERMVLELVQFREREDAISLGQLIVGPLPSPRQNYPIEVTVENREDGTVAVQAYDAQSGVELAQVFGRDGEGGVGHLAMQRSQVRSTMINTL